MTYQGVIITGTSGAGKSAIVAELCNSDPAFVHVPAVTTRVQRADDAPGAYEYMSVETFERLKGNGDFVVSTTYRGQRYAIRRSAIAGIKSNKKIPVLTITPDSVDQLIDPHDKRLGKNLPAYLSVFVDAADQTLDERLKIRTAASAEEVSIQRSTDREYNSHCHYTVLNNDLESTVNLIHSIWTASDSGGVVPDRVMRLMLNCGMLLENAVLKNVQGASYDLSLGDEYFYAGRIHRLSDSEPILMIEPYDYAIVTSHELSNLPRDVCARFDLSIGLFCQGIILSNGPQVDPGFRGPLFCLLFNTSSSPVLLKRRQHYATLEFHKLLEPTYQYHGVYQAKSLLHYLPTNAARGAINELKKELEQVRKESSTLQNATWGILALILALIAVWLTLNNP
jgi:guanylate kinase/deoxycytidine triphosphate deaminase